MCHNDFRRGETGGPRSAELANCPVSILPIRQSALSSARNRARDTPSISRPFLVGPFLPPGGFRQVFDFAGAPYGNRTRVSAVKGRISGETYCLGSPSTEC
jgi:hypothetical protein